jgi:hypothetical protein
VVKTVVGIEFGAVRCREKRKKKSEASLKSSRRECDRDSLRIGIDWDLKVGTMAHETKIRRVK